MTNRTEEDLRQAWAEALRLERHRMRLKQVDVAAMAGVTNATVSKAENGRGSLDSFLAVARALGVDLFAEAS